MTELPRYVRVAKALRWTNLEFKSWYLHDDGTPAEEPQWHGTAPLLNRTGYGTPLNPLWEENIEAGRHWNELWRVPRYDKDWAATGPLIERFRLELAQDESGAWWAETGDIKDPAIQACAATPLEAICELILKLAEAGALKEDHADPDPVRP